MVVIVARRRGWPDEAVVVNLQGDLPTIDSLSIQRCLAGLTNEAADISTIAARIEREEDVANPNIVKAIAPLSDEREVAFARDFVRFASAGMRIAKVAGREALRTGKLLGA